MISNISFVIPVCNTEIIKFSRCINSIEKINIKNYEIIIVDDGSEEENTQKYRTFLKNHSNVKYFKNTNHGVSYSRNYGINNSTKKYSPHLIIPRWMELFQKLVSEKKHN